MDSSPFSHNSMQHYIRQGSRDGYLGSDLSHFRIANNVWNKVLHLLECEADQFGFRELRDQCEGIE